MPSRWVGTHSVYAAGDASVAVARLGAEVEEELRREMERKQQMQAALEQTRDALAHARDSARRLALVKQQAAESKEELTGRLEQQVHGQEPCT